MAQFIVRYQIGDGCTWSAEVVRPVDAESAEEIYCKLSDLRDAKIAMNQKMHELGRIYHHCGGREEDRQAFLAACDEHRDLKRDVNGTSFESWVDCACVDPDSLVDLEIMPLQDWFNKEKERG